MVNKRATLGFGGAGIFLVGVMLLDSHREALAQPYTESPASASPVSFLTQRPAAPAATTVQSFWAPAAVRPARGERHVIVLLLLSFIFFIIFFIIYYLFF